jgi:hypothetical protein
MRVANIQAFADCIHSLERHEAITLGTLTTAVKKDEVNVITKYRLNGHAGPDVIARTSEYISYRPGQPALALIDIDSKGMPAAVRDLIDEKGGYWDSIVSVVPVLANVTRIERNSTSSCLSREDTGEKLPASDGRHIYVVVKDGADVERFLRVLHDRCWLSGLGWYVVSRSGQLLERSIVDRMVFAAERLVFEGPPYVEPPLTQDREARKPKVFNGEPADTATACRDLTAVEQANLDALRRAARFRLKATAEKKKAAYINENAKVLAERAKISAEAARRIIEQQTGGNLLPHIELPFDDPEFKGHTVAQVLADPDRYVGETLADPLEGPDYGTGKAQVLRRADGSLCVHSFAHGRTVYESLLSGFGVVIRERIWFPAGTKNFPFEPWRWSSAVYRFHRSGGERSATTLKPDKSVTNYDTTQRRSRQRFMRPPRAMFPISWNG